MGRTSVTRTVALPNSGSSAAPDYRTALAPYARPDLGRSLLELATSVVPYFGLSVAMYFARAVSPMLALVLAVPTAGFLLRTYIMFHDCSHGSLLPSKRANVWVGTLLGVLVWAPFLRWRHDHAVHHATAGDLDRRGVGDVPTMTVSEYFDSPPRKRRSVMATNVAVALVVGALCWLIGWRDYVLVWAPAALLAGSAGIWLFYVQHQFEETHWERADRWEFADAALQGSSYLRLPRV